MKVILGKTFKSQAKFIAENEGNWPFKVVENSSGRCCIEIEGLSHKRSVEWVVAQLLKSVRKLAESRQNRKIRKAVITVPMSWSSAEKEAMTEASIIAGFTYAHIISEPMAAAMAFHDMEK